MTSTERTTGVSRRRVPTIVEIMRSPAVTVEPDAAVSEAVALMARHDLSELPVVDKASGLIGIIGEADVYRARLTDEQTRFGSADARQPYEGRVVSDLMRHPVITVRDTDTLRLCQLRLMGLARTLPVLHGGEVVGLVDRKRLLAAYAEWDAAAVEVSASVPATMVEPVPSENGRRADLATCSAVRAVSSAAQISVELVMSRPVVTVTPDQTLEEVWHLMSSRGIRHVGVQVDGHCVGVIDDRQVAAVWPEGPAAMKTTRASHLLGRRVACVLPQAPLSEAAAILKDDGVGAVPVTDGHGTLLGLLTAVDIITAAARWGIDATTISDPTPRRELTPVGRTEPGSSPATQRQSGSAAMSVNAAFILAAERPV